MPSHVISCHLMFVSYHAISWSCHILSSHVMFMSYHVILCSCHGMSYDVHVISHPLTHSLSHSPTHSLTLPLTHSLTYSLTLPLTHSLTYSLTVAATIFTKLHEEQASGIYMVKCPTISFENDKKKGELLQNFYGTEDNRMSISEEGGALLKRMGFSRIKCVLGTRRGGGTRGGG